MDDREFVDREFAIQRALGLTYDPNEPKPEGFVSPEAAHQALLSLGLDPTEAEDLVASVFMCPFCMSYHDPSDMCTQEIEDWERNP